MSAARSARMIAFLALAVTGHIAGATPKSKPPKKTTPKTTPPKPDPTPARKNFVVK